MRNENDREFVFTPEGIMTNMAYTAAFAAERMIIVLEHRLKSKGGKLKQEKKLNFTRLRKSLQAARRYYDLAFDNDLIEAANNSGRISDYDHVHEDANEIARLLLLYADKCGYNEHNFEKVFKTLREMDNDIGVITEDVLKDFYMKQ